MPPYEMKCSSCDHVFEELRKSTDQTPVKCPRCGPVAKAAMDFAAEEPEMAVVVVAFLVGLLCPCRERVCERVIVACCDARIARTKREKKT